MSGYEGDGSGVDFSGSDAPQSDGPPADVTDSGNANWGGGPASSGTEKGSGWAGKPGESRMADAKSKVLGSVANRPEYQDTEGWNSENPTQPVGHLENSLRANDFLSWAAPAGISALIPGAGLVMSAAKLGGKIASGASAEEVAADILPGIINSGIGRVAGPVYATARKVSDVVGAMGGPTLPNFGKELVAGIMGTPGRTASPSTQVAAVEHMAGPGEGAADMPSAPVTTAELASAATTASAKPAFQMPSVSSSLGLDAGGWAKATREYLS